MERNLFTFALGTRIFVIILQYFSNILIPDHNAGVFIYPQGGNASYNAIDKIIHHFLGGFVRWDAQYFMHIAKYGYTYENTLAFFPFYPLLVRLLGLAIYSIFPVIHLDSILLLVFIGINITLFVLSAKTLYTLSAIIFDKKFAYKSTLLFCINPASIFFSGPYSECIFCYLTFQSILNCIVLYKKYSDTKYVFDYRHILYVLPISLSAVVRSNGLLNIGFLAYTYFCICIRYWPKRSFMSQIFFLTSAVLILSVLLIICLLPFLIYQIYCYYMFCSNFDANLPLDLIAYSEKNNFVLPGQFSNYNQSWCFDTIPLAYSYVQNHYWNVGFLKYYELKQLPNFLLAAPILIFLIKNSIQHIIRNVNKNIFSVFSFHRLFVKKKETITSYDPVLNVFVIHILFLSLFCVFFVHIQVSTRMLCSASPVFYWYCANYFRDRELNKFVKIFSDKLSLNEYIIIIYFLSYFLIGTVLFCNFLPWT